MIFLIGGRSNQPCSDVSKVAKIRSLHIFQKPEVNGDTVLAAFLRLQRSVSQAGCHLYRLTRLRLHFRPQLGPMSEDVLVVDPKDSGKKCTYLKDAKSYYVYTSFQQTQAKAVPSTVELKCLNVWPLSDSIAGRYLSCYVADDFHAASGASRLSAGLYTLVERSVPAIFAVRCCARAGQLKMLGDVFVADRAHLGLFLAQLDRAAAKQAGKWLLLNTLRAFHGLFCGCFWQTFERHGSLQLPPESAICLLCTFFSCCNV
mmetsp:Transcript_84460/g.161452  ORF Transcript_84460/g.161452 Transcript_84460/m.161452 type:complete len:259 (+) Transcript_84460:1114-1890(+)